MEQVRGSNPLTHINFMPPNKHASNDASVLKNLTTANVKVENAVDGKTFLLARGKTSDRSMREVSDLVRTMKDVTSDMYENFRVFYGIGEESDEYLIRIEYP